MYSHLEMVKIRQPYVIALKNMFYCGKMYITIYHFNHF